MKTTPNRDKLIKLLEKAEQLSSQFRGGYSDHFLSAEEFHIALKTSIERYKQGDNEQLDYFYIWFSPSYDWDDFSGADGQNLANEIFVLLNSKENNVKLNLRFSTKEKVFGTIILIICFIALMYTFVVIINKHDN